MIHKIIKYQELRNNDVILEQLQAALSMIPGLQMNMPNMQQIQPNMPMMPVQGMMVQQMRPGLQGAPIFPGQPG